MSFPFARLFFRRGKDFFSEAQKMSEEKKKEKSPQRDGGRRKAEDVEREAISTDFQGLFGMSHCVVHYVFTSVLQIPLFVEFLHINQIPPLTSSANRE